MFEANIDGVEFTLPCPKCGHETKALGRKLKAEGGFTCGGCGSRVDTNARELEQQATDIVRRSVESFGKSLGKSFKRR